MENPTLIFRETNFVFQWLVGARERKKMAFFASFILSKIFLTDVFYLNTYRI